MTYLDVHNFSQPQKAMLIGLFLARFDREGVQALGYQSFNMTFNELGELIGVPANSIKIYRNKFDTFFPNARVGFSRYYERQYFKYFYSPDYCDFDPTVEPIITLIDATQNWTFKQFIDVIRAFIYPNKYPLPEIATDNPVVNESSVQDQETKESIRPFDKLSQEFYSAFHQLFSIGKQQEDLLQQYNENEIPLFAIIEELDTILISNQESFDDYKICADSLMRFMENYWNKFDLLSTVNKGLLWFADLFVFYKGICHQISEATNFIEMRLNTSDVICSYSIVSILQEAFVLLFKDKDPSLLQRYLVYRAQETILRINHGYFHRITHQLKVAQKRAFTLIDILKSHDRERFTTYFTYPQSSHKPNVCLSDNQVELKDGLLKAKLAYDIFDESIQNHRVNCDPINALKIDLTTECKTIINGRFEITWKSMGYIAQTDDEIILAFRGSKCKEDWITNWLQLSVGPDISYQCALGLLLVLRERTDVQRRINVYGHSLGGGLSQFAVAATTKDDTGLMTNAYCYNSAGLSDYTLFSIGVYPTEIGNFSNIQHLQHKSDIVHTWDYQLGTNYYVGKDKILKKFIKICHYHSIDTIMTTTGTTGELILIIH